MFICNQYEYLLRAGPETESAAGLHYRVIAGLPGPIRCIARPDDILEIFGILSELAAVLKDRIPGAGHSEPAQPQRVIDARGRKIIDELAHVCPHRILIIQHAAAVVHQKNNVAQPAAAAGLRRCDLEVVGLQGAVFKNIEVRLAQEGRSGLHGDIHIDKGKTLGIEADHRSGKLGDLHHPYADGFDLPAGKFFRLVGDQSESRTNSGAGKLADIDLRVAPVAESGTSVHDGPGDTVVDGDLEISLIVDAFDRKFLSDLQNQLLISRPDFRQADQRAG